MLYCIVLYCFTCKGFICNKDYYYIKKVRIGRKGIFLMTSEFCIISFITYFVKNNRSILPFSIDLFIIRDLCIIVLDTV